MEKQARSRANEAIIRRADPIHDSYAHTITTESIHKPVCSSAFTSPLYLTPIQDTL